MKTALLAVLWAIILNVLGIALLAEPPSNVSMSPSSGAGPTQTFAFTASTQSGYTNMAWMQVIFNSGESKAGGCYVYVYLPGGGTAYLANDAGDNWLGSAALGSSGTMENSQCRLSLAGSSMSGSGNNVTLNLAFTFKTGFLGTQNAYLYAGDSIGQTSNWQQMGTWTVPGATAPSAVSFSPNSGSGNSQTFTATFTDPAGAADIQYMQIWFTASTSSGGANSCMLLLPHSTGQFQVLNDAGTAWQAPIPPGQTDQNSQCILNTVGSTFTYSGNTATMTVNLTFKTAFSGNKGAWLWAANFGGQAAWSGQMGSWTVPGGSLSGVSVSPSSGSGSSQTFTANYSDSLGASDVEYLAININSSNVASSSCYVLYYIPLQQFYIMNDAGTSWGSPITPGASASSSQCTLNTGSSTYSPSGNTATLSVSVAFTSAFAGAKGVWLYIAGYNTGQTWSSQLGSWTATAPSAVATPSITPGGGTYSSPQTVSISTMTSGASIRYTTNGTTPSETNGTLYSGGFTVSNTTTVRAIAYKSGMTDSSVNAATDVIQPSITTSSPLPGVEVGVSYSQQFQVAGGTFPYTWTSTSGTIPPGLTLYSNGAFAGTPTTSGTYTFVVRVSDSTALTAQLSFMLTVTPFPVITTVSPLAGGTAGSYYSQTFSATFGTPPYSWSMPSPNQLPIGLTLSANGVLSGFPVVASTFSFSVQVADAIGKTSTASFSLTTSSNTSTIAGSSSLQVNLSFMPFTFYDYSHLATSYNFSMSCPSGAMVRSCFQSILANMRGQGVSGVRIFVTLCDASSQAFANCGLPNQTWATGAWNPAVNPGQATWINNVNAFFTDVHNANIPNVTVTLAHTGPPTDNLPAGSTTSPSGSACALLPATVYFTPMEPFGLAQQPDGINYYPIGSDNFAYNCAPVNPYFLGWNNQFDAIGAMLGAARAASVNIFELEFEQELNLVQFTAQLRLFYDNAHPTSAGLAVGQTVDIVSRLRTLMSTFTFDPNRVTWSGFVSDATDATTNCTNVYTDYSRLFSLDSIASAIGGGYVGINPDATTQNLLYCGGNEVQNFMLPSPISNTQPAIVDVHAYPHVLGAGTSDTQVQQVATVDFGDLPHFLQLVNLQSALVVIGETHRGTPYQGYQGTSPCATAPNSAATSTVAGFNASALAGYSVVFRPWMEIEDPTGVCYPYPNYQNVNFNGTGPYTPTKQ